MAKSIGFIGNCQIATMSGLYRRLLDENSRIDVFYIPSYKEADEAQQRQIASADIIVQQMLDFEQKIGALKTDAKTILFPHVSGAFLWPYAGSAHPKNGAFPFFDQNGPYSAEMGDSFLNRMIMDQVAPEEAVTRYMDTDVATVKRVERLKEIVLDKQRARDRACGYDFADWIEANFQTRPLFRSPSHLEIPLTMHLAGRLFEKLEMDPSVVAQAAANPPGGLFPISATPIHPGVIDKFGIRYIPNSHRYRFFDEGNFTFEEYAGRYMRFEWNPKLAEGLHWFRSGDKDKALGALEVAVVSSPRSAIGRFVLSDLLAKQNRLAEAIQRAREAVELEPDNKHFQQRLDHFQHRRGQAPETTPKPEPVAGVTLDFGRAGNAKNYMTEGWSNPEVNYTWTNGSRARLQIKGFRAVDNFTLKFTAAPFAPPVRPYQRITILVNDIELGKVAIEESVEIALTIPPGSIPAPVDPLILTFELPDAARPVDFDSSNSDSRLLGLAFRRLSFSPNA